MQIQNKVLILTMSTGQGHNAVADVLRKEFEKNGYEVTIEEPLKKSRKEWDKIITRGYEVLAVKFPHLYDFLYKLTDIKVIYKTLTKITNMFIKNKFYNIIHLYEPDIIISTHALLIEPICLLKKKGKVKIPLISIVTDYKAHQSYINKNVDAYITASGAINERLIKNGVLKDRIYMYGIPVRDNFTVGPDKTKKSDIFTILLMGGSMGVPQLKGSLTNILKIKYKVRVIVVCGKNEKLKLELQDISKEYHGDKIIDILGFSSKIAEFMDESDVIVTKPGGITVTEALYKEIPIIISYYIPGHEEENRDVLVDEGAAIYVKNELLGKEIEKLIESDYEIEDLKKNIRKMTKTYSIGKIVYVARKLIDEYCEKKTAV